MEPRAIKTISEFHTLRGLPKPKHPLISVIRFADMKNKPKVGGESWYFDFYCISLKRNMNHKYRYGQQDYDFDEGLLFFMAPQQLLRIEIEEGEVRDPEGWMLIVHPDFLWGKPIASTIKSYEFFDYALHEALFLSEKEEQQMEQLIQNIEQEYNNPTDKFSKDIILSQLETLFGYSNRFYQRQFLTRDKANHELLERLEKLLHTYLNDPLLMSNGLPTVQELANKLHLSPSYLRSVLHLLTGQSTQQYIQQKLTDKAKIILTTTNLSVSEIAYELGFEHPQSFSKFFKKMTNSTPLAFRQLFLS